MGYTNFAEFFIHIAAVYGARNAIYWRQSTEEGNDNGKYKSITGNKLKELVYLTSIALEKLGMKPGDKAAIISESRFEWVVADFACIMNRLVTVPIYTTMTSSQIKFILEHSEAKVCFVSTQLIADKVKAVSNELPKLEHIISFNKITGSSGKVFLFEDLIYESVIGNKESYKEEEADKYFAERAKLIKSDDLLTIIYTSGTTGTPKGICLSHKNILSNVEACGKAFDVTSSDRFLSFLPLAHSYERTTGYYFALSSGAEIYYAKNIDTLQTQLAEVKPTLFTSVPLLYNRIYSRLMKNLKSMPVHKQVIAKWAFKVARKNRGRKNSYVWKLADKLAFKKIRERTGGKFRIIISGGSALNREIAEFFDGIGIRIFEGYGLTETSPVISVNRVARNKFGTVGIPLDGVNVRIADDGEILVKGGSVMMGYYKDEEETNKTIIDGWLHTGDIGEIDSEGFLKITDRKKSLIKTEGGKYISLTHIEDTLTTSDYIDQVSAFAADDKPFVSALIVPNFDELKSFADAKNISYYDERELAQNTEVTKLIESEINRVQADHAKYERVRKFTLLANPFTIEGGELTPSLKIKRRVVEEKYKDAINRMYGVK